MSAQLPPDPILTTYQYWNWANVDEATRRQRALDNTYMTFPTVQNYPTFFSKLFFITDATLTKMANTSYVYSLIQSLLSSINTWTGSNAFNSIKVDTLANMTLNNPDFAGTELLPTTLTNSTFNEPFTPLYSYPIIPVGGIGYVIQSTLTSDISSDGTYGRIIRTVSLTPGVWLLSGFVARAATGVSGYYAIGFVTNLSGLNETGRKGTFDISSQASFPGYFASQTTPFIATANTSMSLYSRTQQTFTLTSSGMVAVRIG